MKRLVHALTLLILLTFFTSPVYAIQSIGEIHVNTTRVKTEKELVKTATLIVHAVPIQTSRAYVKKGREVNYVQTLQVKDVLKGTLPHPTIQIVQPGLIPPPKKDDPLLKIYPGPLFKHDYVFFLKPIVGTTYYSLVGIWQGVYPLDSNGRTIALEEGFRVFDHLTIAQMKKKIREIGES
ncbi:hypothetical protein DNHGIG_13200 [Collibacillus ludicampi]|jgi:hypothetical protein|uniref:Uncharacterized protein n=1 Tax=Collibacillus ludicampi TaxID=2771369 RepID=A0AAV4LD84_9BACL|nr:hypothetical protein [Collibacillus ludicampi]GIM45771.1 hypothetical protein DNHGIG_13200 [Collibacillus ludicampi]